MVEGLLKGLKKEDGLQGPLSSRVLDQGDAVGAWYGKDQGGPLAAVLFATSETLKQVQCGFAAYVRLVLHAHCGMAEPMQAVPLHAQRSAYLCLGICVLGLNSYSHNCWQN